VVVAFVVVVVVVVVFVLFCLQCNPSLIKLKMVIQSMGFLTIETIVVHLFWYRKGTKRCDKEIENKIEKPFIFRPK
jgi:hypothetical protein